MLDNTVQAVELLPDDADQWQCPTLLDANAIDKFLEWLQSNPEYIDPSHGSRRPYTERLIDKTWKIRVLQSHIAARPDAARIRRQLGTFQIEVKSFNVTRQRTFVTELQRAYFGNEADSAQSAELLAYGRQESTDGRHVRIISRHRGFRLVPHIALYFVPTANEIGNDSNATFLRTFTALDLHTAVEHAAYERIRNQDYPLAVLQAVQVLFEKIREIGQTAQPGLAALDGYQLVHQALDSDRRAGRYPHIKFNNLVSDSEWSEQKGFHDFACGTASALRNTIAHGPADEPFIRERFGDRRTALKFLCLLSLLFEKLDARVAP